MCVCVWHSEQTVFAGSLENGRQIVTHSWVDRYRRTSERKNLFSMFLKLTRRGFFFVLLLVICIYDVLYELSGKFMSVAR